MRRFGIVVGLICVSLLTGCATLDAHNQLYGPPEDSHRPGPLEKHCPPIFKGVYYDTSSIGLGLVSPIYPTVDTPRYSILLTPFAAVDLPLSLMADIFYFSSDVNNWRHPDEWIGWPPGTVLAANQSNATDRLALTLSIDGHLKEVTYEYFFLFVSRRTRFREDQFLPTIVTHPKGGDTASLLSIQPSPNLIFGGNRISFYVQYHDRQKGNDLSLSETIEAPLFKMSAGKKGLIKYRLDWSPHQSAFRTH